KKLLNFSAISVEFEVIVPFILRHAVKFLFFAGLLVARLISSQVFLELDWYKVSCCSKNSFLLVRMSEL
ncbi:MAG: hypothetical protein ACK559_08680, partial [bacterium]